MKLELEKANNTTKELTDEVKKRESVVEELTQRLDGLSSHVPENLPAIL